MSLIHYYLVYIWLLNMDSNGTTRKKFAKRLRDGRRKAMERRILHIQKIEKIQSKHIGKRINVKDELTQAVSLKWRWSGHIARVKDSR